MLVAVSEHIERFAALAREMATTETRESRRDELLAMAENCDLIAHQPPHTFWQAQQLLYYIQLKLQNVNKIRSGSHSKASAGSPLYQFVTIGGHNLVDGLTMDAVNPLSKLRSYRPPAAADFLAGAATVLLHPIDVADRI